MKKQLRSTLVVAVIASLVLAACAAPAPVAEPAAAAPATALPAPTETTGAAKGLRFGFVLPDLSNPFINGLAVGAKDAADANGVELLVTGDDSSEGQVNATLNYIAAGVDVIGIDAIDAPAISAAVEAANKAGIPVIMVQASTETGDIATFIAADNVQGGVLIGESIVEWCADINPCKVGVIEGNLADQSGVDEDTGMRSVVKKHANIKIVGNAPTNYDPAEALNVATNLLTANPDINFLYSWWDAGALAALEAVREVGKVGKIGIAGFGGNCGNLQELIEGNIYHETMFFPTAMGAAFVKAGLDVLNGKTLEPVTDADIFGMTTPKAKKLLSGEVAPPKDLPEVLKKLEKARDGC
ncbi:MAG: sugar ABC transporter substrate-binding protein [Chloroflexi bacterium]|nr:sugar ABC transporter substrate-binding protein [Chloroflexota bacterium]